MTVSPLRVGLGEYDVGWHDPEASLARAREVIAAAVAAGARLVVLPEMAPTGFTMDPAQAVPVDGTVVASLSALAHRHRSWLLAGVALQGNEEGTDTGARATNAALLIDPAGDIVATHRKRRLFAYGDEHRHYAAGTDATVTTVDGVRIGIFICYELRFPALFAELAPQVDAMLVIANWPAARRAHWDALLPARAIENQCYVIGVNRTGSGGGIEYDGGSVAYDPWGERLAGPERGSAVAVVSVDPTRVGEIRTRYPFLRDR